ncbi:MAG: hypothetical protein H7293_16685 [Candidatus Saccharibacteria bacterium]|nr:hypothetical protein [Rhodoferax sp.]
MTQQPLKALAADVDSRLKALNLNLDDLFKAMKQFSRAKQRNELKKRIHTAVLDMAVSHPDLALSREELFAEVGKLQPIARSGSVVEALYYEAVAEGGESALRRRINP